MGDKVKFANSAPNDFKR